MGEDIQKNISGVSRVWAHQFIITNLQIVFADAEIEMRRPVCPFLFGRGVHG